MSTFFHAWHEAARVSLGLFWMAFWAFGLGYLISSMIQVFVTRERMRSSMGDDGPRSIALGSFFGFISSSCSFAALSTTRALFAKGAGFASSLAFLLASTNLVIELGIVIAVFLGWQFVVGEYVGGVLLILLVWLGVHVTRPRRLIKRARENARAEEEAEDDDAPDWRELIRSREGWRRVARRYGMEWGMVWQDVAVGFTVAGIIAALVPPSFFEALFVGSGGEAAGPLEVLLQALVAPLAAFFTFIGSMGNIPLAAVLYDNGVAFAGIMAFLFSDLVVWPVLRIQSTYYGWRAALYIAGLFLAALVATALLMHYAFDGLGLLPQVAATGGMQERTFFSIDATFWLDVAFLLLTVVFFVWTRRTGHGGHDHDHAGESEPSWGARVLLTLACMALLWVGAGVTILPWLGYG